MNKSICHTIHSSRTSFFIGSPLISGSIRGNLALIAVIFLALLLNGCTARSITLRVRDRQTGQPVPGAAVLAWWESTVYISGVPSKKPSFIVEGCTDETGSFSIVPDETNLHRTPRIKIYKPNYVGWSDRWVYLGPVNDFQNIADQVRTHDQVRGNRVIYLEPWHADYDRESHLAFLTQHLPAPIDSTAPEILDYLKVVLRNEKVTEQSLAAHPANLPSP